MKQPSNIPRLLVLAGSVVLATDQGRLAASPNEAIVAEAGEPPQKLLLEACKLRVGQSEIDRLIHTGDPITPDQAKLRVANAICGDKGSSKVNCAPEDVAWTFGRTVAASRMIGLGKSSNPLLRKLKKNLCPIPPRWPFIGEHTTRNDPE